MDTIWDATNNGTVPVVTDLSSCTHTLQHMRPALSEANKSRFDKIRIIDSIDFLHDTVIPVCKIQKRMDKIVLHPVCSLESMGIEDKFRRMAEYFAREVVIPEHSGCCGMAGDRGFIYPELTHAATLPEAEEVKCDTYQGYYSSAKTCEMAMSEAVGKDYESILYLADACIL